MGVLAFLLSGRYVQFLRQVEGTQLQLFLAAIFLVIAGNLRNDGPLTSVALQRFPLTPAERIVIRAFSALTPPLSWLVLIFALGVFRPLSKLGVIPVFGGIALIGASLAASQIALPLPKFQPRSRKMSLFRKEIRYVRALPEHLLVMLITLTFCIYLYRGQGLQSEATRVVFGLLSILSVRFPMNAFGLDGGAGLDRYALSPITGSHILRTKNRAFATIVAVQRAPVLLMTLWRFGPREALYVLIEAVSLTLLVMAWGNVVSVWHPTGPHTQPTLLDGLIGAAAALSPAAATLVILRTSAWREYSIAAMLTGCALSYYVSLTYSGSYFTRRFDKIRASLVD